MWTSSTFGNLYQNANKNINIIIEKMAFLRNSGNTVSEYHIALDFYDLALNVHSRFFEDDEKSYGEILLDKAIKIFDYNLDKGLPLLRHEEVFELLNKCLEIFSEDEENSKQELQKIHKHLTYFYLDDFTATIINTRLVHEREVIKLEREIHGEIRRNGIHGYENLITLKFLGTSICRIYQITSPELLKIHYDEATGYLLEALAIAESNALVRPLEIADTYNDISFCEYVRAEKGIYARH